MSNLKQDERDTLLSQLSVIVGFEANYAFKPARYYFNNKFLTQGEVTALLDTILANYTLKTEATAAQERAVAEAELKAACNELQPIHSLTQKPKDYDKMDTIAQTFWVVKTLGKIGSYCNDRKATLDKLEARLALHRIEARDE